MSKKNKKADNNKTENEIREESVNPYDIKKDAVDRLVNASAETAPKVSEEEIAKYRGKKKFHIPNTLKVMLIKWWFYGAMCFFFYWGLGTVISDWDLIFVFAAATGLLSDLLLNHLLRFIEKSYGENDKFMMVNERKFWSVFLNILYGFLIMAIVMYIYNLINIAIAQISGDTSTASFGVEPLSFGLIYLGVDMLLVLVKNTFKKIIDDAKNKAGEK